VAVSHLDDVQINAEYAVVKIDLLHEFAKDIKLDVPPDDMTITLRDALARRVQWRRTGIDIDPADTDSVATSHSQPQRLPVPQLGIVGPSLTFSEPRPQLPNPEEAFPDPTQTQITPPPPVQTTEPATAPKKPSKPNPVRKKQSRPIQRKQEILEGKKKVEEIKNPAPRALTSHNPKYRVGKALLSAAELRRAGQYCMELHNYYIHNADKVTDIVVAYKERHFLQLEGTEGIFTVAFSDLFDLFNLDALDLSLLRCFAL